MPSTTLIPKLKRGVLVAVAVMMAGGLLPVAAFADDPAPCVPPPNNTPGIIRPVGADASQYTYNCNDGLWENAHFSFNPATGTYTALDPVVYTYNATTGKYDYVTWVFDAPTNTYVPVTQSIAAPPSGATVVGAPTPPAAATTAPTTDPSITNTGPGSTNTIDTNGGTLGGSIANTGPDSTNTLGGSGTSNTTLNNLTNATLNNLLNSTAASGNAGVLANTTGGSAATGNAQALANVVNMLQSSSNALGGNTTTFVANINGDVNGDLLIDPNALAAVQPAAVNTTTGNNNLTVNNQVNAAINNDINLNAASGNATVADNTSAGNATTGNATAIANVVNLINSAITSGKSFLGVVNINGNFNGDILLPPNLIDQLIAANVPTVTISTTGPDSTNTVTNGQSGNNTTITNTNNQGITNNVSAGAASGNASVTNNTTAGSATSGTATTNITAFNLTGSNVIGNNDLLVFVNVLGKWVGMIVNAPPGTTAAELGGGITTASTVGNNNTTINNTANQQITNNINANAQSGDASVASNTKAGNAQSGNAHTAVNLMNIEGSNLSLANWFGILFINVFGTWNGSFGINTAAGDPIPVPPVVAAVAATNSSVPAPVQVFHFVPHAAGSAAVIASTAPSSVNSDNSVLAAHVNKSVASLAPQPRLASPHSNYMLPIVGAVVFVLLIAGDRLFVLFRR